MDKLCGIQMWIMWITWWIVFFMGNLQSIKKPAISTKSDCFRGMVYKYYVNVLSTKKSTCPYNLEC